MKHSDDYLTALIEDNSDDINDVSLTYDLSEIEVDSLSYSYGSFDSLELSGAPIIEDDLVVIDKYRMFEVLKGLNENDTNEVWQDDQDCIATIRTCCVYALREHLQGRVVLGTNENGLTSIDTEQLLNNMVISITDRVKASK